MYANNTIVALVRTKSRRPNRRMMHVMKNSHSDVIRTVGRFLRWRCIVVFCAMPSTLHAATPPRDQLTVMSRNLYLGADVYAAAQLLPDLQAASQFIWDHGQQTSFVARADAFADEIMRTRPDVIGLQEAATWYCRDAYARRAQVVSDYTQLLIEALARRGVAYMVAHAPNALPAHRTGFSLPTVPYVTTVHDTTIFTRCLEPIPLRVVSLFRMCCWCMRPVQVMCIVLVRVILSLITPSCQEYST